ncbi:MAG: NAD(P)-dependent oxidoreductase [Paraprevotella sp.]|nr:NAD(P)-dependent oxidoreductase [Paraprevotella sp.]
MKILVTGASGFIGSFIVEEGLRRGHRVWAGMRATSSRKYLTDPKTEFVELDLEHPDTLRPQLAACKEDFGGWDIVVHAAGATKCIRREDFFRTNTEGTKHLADALRELDMTPRRFIFISSLSVFGAIREQAVRDSSPEHPWIYDPIREDDAPRPNTAYGESKREAEQYLQSLSGFPYVILRPTGVYGPREKDYFVMAQSVKQHIDFTVGYRPQEITFVYVKDLVQAVFLAMEKEVIRRAFFVSDGQVYHSTEFSDLIREELGRPFMLRLCAPVWFLRLACSLSGSLSTWRGKTSTLNRDKFHILCQRNWQCDIRPATEELGYRPEYPLAGGVKETIEWYKKEGWL